MTDLFLEIALPDKLTTAIIATLGPAGTSSEAAAADLRRRVGAAAPAVLHDCYEDAAAAVMHGEADLLLVANAYAKINNFYMDPTLCLAAVFVYRTPQYGLAIRPGADLMGSLSIASHPAPVPIIDQLLPAGLSVAEVLHVQSTSLAAAAVRSGVVPMALTTAPAAAAHGLDFVSRTRPITMLWSVFRRACVACQALTGMPKVSAA